MRILRFDSVGGASGDMILGAIVGLGADAGTLSERLSGLGIGKVTVACSAHEAHGWHGLITTVACAGRGQDRSRGLAEIKDLIMRSGLPEGVKSGSAAVFERLARAEACAHGIAPDQVHFHETGALDSIADIVGCCLGIEMLGGVDGAFVGPLPVGCGTVRCEHGLLPVPAPATVELLKGHPVIQTDEPSELVTPTGAALLMSWKMNEGPDGRRWNVAGGPAHSFGHRNLGGRPNLLRAMLLESVERAAGRAGEECAVLECNIDDMNPELIGSLTQRLLEEGALDVFATPVQMKKQRPGTLITVLCRPEQSRLMMSLIFAESTTFGVREHMARRTVLERRHVEVGTPYGPVRVKVGAWAGKDVTCSPEYEDCVKLARERGVPVRTVYEAASRAAGGSSPLKTEN